jgi:hypothetical protein
LEQTYFIDDFFLIPYGQALGTHKSRKVHTPDL